MPCSFLHKVTRQRSGSHVPIIHSGKEAWLIFLLTKKRDVAATTSKKSLGNTFSPCLWRVYLAICKSSLVDNMECVYAHLCCTFCISWWFVSIRDGSCGVNVKIDVNSAWESKFLYFTETFILFVIILYQTRNSAWHYQILHYIATL